MPGMVFFSKMVPHQVEGTMIGIAISVIKFSSEVVARVWTYLFDLIFRVGYAGDTEEIDYSNLWKLCLIQASLLAVPFFFFNFLIKKSEVESVQVLV